MAASPDPVSAAEFGTLVGRLGPFEPGPHLAVAVSGGRDSLALALLAHDWAAARGGRVTGVIVDHGLRHGSAAEAVLARETLAGQGVAAALLTVAGRPRNNLQAWARAARYALMADWCRGAGVLHLLVAHQRDDQAETLLAALARGTGGVAGMAGMAAIRELPSCRILRPLLDIPRDRLTATLRCRNAAWLDDPSNRDRRFRRVRLRERLASGREGPALAARAQAAGEARQRFERRVADLLVATVALAGGHTHLDRAGLRRAEAEIATAAIAALLRRAGGGQPPLRQDRLARIAVWLRGAAQRGRRTVAGCAIGLDGDRATLAPAPGRRDAPGPAAAMATADRPALAPAAFAPLPRAGAAEPGERSIRPSARLRPLDSPPHSLI